MAISWITKFRYLRQVWAHFLCGFACGTVLTYDISQQIAIRLEENGLFTPVLFLLFSYIDNWKCPETQDANPFWRLESSVALCVKMLQSMLTYIHKVSPSI